MRHHLLSRQNFNSCYRKRQDTTSLQHKGRKRMKKALMFGASAVFLLAAGGASAADKQLVIVVKGLDNPFFEAIHQGCEKWNGENANSGYHCFYTGPASTSDEAGEVQIISDLLGKPDTAAMAISPSNAPLVANAIKTANPSIPIMTVDADLKKEDSALRLTYLGTDNYLMGYKLGEYLKKAQPKGGTLCTIEGNPAADNILRRAQGSRDSLSGQKGLDALKGEGGWTEVSGCPVFTNDDGPKGVQDRKSTRLNSSHQIISYAVFCLKKKKMKKYTK